MNSPKTLNLKGRLLSLDEPKIMGILNITEDSFYEGSRVQSEVQIIEKARQMLNDGAAFLDIGGYSSRPGADDISVEEETKRVIEAISTILGEFPEALISVDTFRQSVAEAAIKSGAVLVNDISGGNLDDKMIPFICEGNIPYIAMHMKGNPQTMQQQTDYDDLLGDIMYYFSSLIEELAKMGHSDLIIDPGFGFAKTLDQNYELLNHLDYFTNLDRPMLAGLSRKSMIYKELDISPEDALNGTSVLNTLALSKGANILRVHDVRAAKEVVRLTQKTLNC